MLKELFRIGVLNTACQTDNDMNEFGQKDVCDLRWFNIPIILIPRGDDCISQSA